MAQTPDSGAVPPPVVKKKPVITRTVADSLRPKVRVQPVKKDTLKAAVATTPAAVAGADTSLLRKDSVAVPKVKPVSAYDVYMKKLAAENMFLKPGRPTFYDNNPLRTRRDMDWLAYLIGGVLLVLSVIRLSYLKYFSDLFRAFLNPTLSQRQLKDQLSQSPFPNMLLNIFFALSLGVYLYLVLYRNQVFPQAEPWLLIPGLVALVAVVYGTKYVMLRFCGWLFGNVELADAYIFILYLINKILGVLLVPFLIVMAFCRPNIAIGALYISIFFIVLLVVYRYIRSYSLVKQYLSFSKLHFFLYLCAFEVAPVLILTKVLLNIWLTGNP
ncbi:DUF4271 domain-containing protein [Chitinophaga nivalis]|uniref:DUF4271 domain-containing protein n=1 Tax=Chitinophaga nivalis TaxID=2991709 RepID=A0ABT3IUF9_9BACT|nr:DUF4271 domain-containing protein [Chitinophaga nivalis]MCW3462687.1 DUF4271 domain-containing protein [Chitinophaga nivalis]MCW3487622.1 DUF4271 domain-containing protein [Chitinophaga nivalis]